MKQFFQNIILFLIGLLVFIVGTDVLIDRNVHDFIEAKYEEIYEQKTNAEVVIIGASRGMRAINPAFLDFQGKPIYNFCYQGSNPEFTLMWYNKLFKEKYRKPSTIIYTIDWMMFDPAWLERKFEHDSEFFSTQDFWTSFLRPDGLSRSDLLFNWLVLRKDVFNLQYVFSEKTNYLPDEMEKYDRGFIPRNDEFFRTPRKTAKFDSTRIRQFEELLQQFQKEDIEVILVQCPEFKPEETKPNKMDSIINQMAAQYDLKSFDYNEALAGTLNQDKNNFFNWSHLNEKGATRFSKQFNLDLKNR